MQSLFRNCSKQLTFKIQQMMNGALKQTPWAKKLELLMQKLNN